MKVLYFRGICCVRVCLQTCEFDFLTSLSPSESFIIKSILRQTNIAGWNITICNRKCIFNQGSFSIAMLVYQSVPNELVPFLGPPTMGKPMSRPSCLWFECLNTERKFLTPAVLRCVLASPPVVSQYVATSDGHHFIPRWNLFLPFSSEFIFILFLYLTVLKVEFTYKLLMSLKGEKKNIKFSISLPTTTFNSNKTIAALWLARKNEPGEALVDFNQKKTNIMNQKES